MSHHAELHAVPTPFKREHLTDWDAGINWIEQGVPAWEPGTAVGYHAVMFSWIVGGIVAVRAFWKSKSILSALH